MTKLLISATVTLSLATGAANAQTFADKIDYLANSQTTLKAEDLPVMVPFAYEWNKLGIDVFDGAKLAAEIDYGAYQASNQGIVEENIKIFQNGEMATYLDSDAAQETFLKIYSHAQETNSPIASLPADKAMEYWIISKAASENPEYFAGQHWGSIDDDVQVQFCIWLFIKCGPPKPAPKE